jgi:hypothetical protein
VEQIGEFGFWAKREVSRGQYSPHGAQDQHVALLITPELYDYQSYKQNCNLITITRLMVTVLSGIEQAHKETVVYPWGQDNFLFLFRLLFFTS